MRLEQLLETCGKHGVTRITATTDDAGQVSLELVPSTPEKIIDPDEAEMRMAPRVGRDGLTAEAQAELYARPMSDTEN